MKIKRIYISLVCVFLSILALASIPIGLGGNPRVAAVIMLIVAIFGFIQPIFLDLYKRIEDLEKKAGGKAS